MADFKIGDVVYLKSTGPKMTVERLGSWDGKAHAECVWFDKSIAKHGTFPVAALVTEDGMTYPL